MEYSDYLESLDPADALTGDEIFGISQGGKARSLTLDDIADYVGAGGGTTFEDDRAWSSELLFDKNDIYYADHVQTGAINFTIAAAGNLVDGTSVIRQRITSDGTNTISFTGFDPDYVKGITSGDILPAGDYEFWFNYVNGTVSVSVPGDGGAVDSVNGQTGVVVLDAGDVGADPAGSAATVASNLSAHIADTTDAHDASAISFSATGGISATDVQAAIAELDTEKAPLNSPAFAGNPTAPTPSAGDNDTSVATTAFVNTATVGVQDLFIPAAAMWPRNTNGCAALAQTELATSLINIKTLDFDPTTEEYAQFHFKFPRKYNLGTITASFEWITTSGSGSVVWKLGAVAISDNEAMTATFGTPQLVTDAAQTTNTLRNSADTAAITIAGSPAAADGIFFQVAREAGNGSDDYTPDAKLSGIWLHITTNAAKDA